MSSKKNKSWNLESFLDSFILELDKARDTLAVKGVNKPLTYAVKDISMDLQLFPEYDGDEIRFTTAKAGEGGSSKMTIQLGSITDRQIRETSKEPISEDDVSIEAIEDIEPEAKRSLQKIGITSVKDLEKLEAKKIAMDEIAGKISKKTNYSSLAEKLKKLRDHNTALSLQKALVEDREIQKPSVDNINLKKSNQNFFLYVSGKNLHIDSEFIPEATINDMQSEIIVSRPDMLVIHFNPDFLKGNNAELKVKLDRITEIKLKIK